MSNHIQDITEIDHCRYRVVMTSNETPPGTVVAKHACGYGNEGRVVPLGTRQWLPYPLQYATSVLTVGVRALRNCTAYVWAIQMVATAHTDSSAPMILTLAQVMAGNTESQQTGG